MRILLVFPPTWTPTLPYLSLPTLTAYLRQHGLQVTQRDLNVEFYDRVLGQDYMADALERLIDDYGAAAGLRRHSAPATPPPELLRWALEVGPEAAGRIDAAKQVVRSEAFYEGPVGYGAMRVVYQCLCVASLPFYPASLRLQSCTPAVCSESSSALLAAVGDPRRNMFLEPFREGILADIQREEPDIVGISVASLHQLLAALTLARLIKEQGPEKCHVTLGGPHITMIREALAQTPALFRLFDSAVAFEGEAPLLRLAQAVEGDGDLSQVPNLI